MKNLDSILPVSEEGLYPIRSVSEITGVNSITLRAWERRYGLFQPKRTPKGHRLYSDKDILRIQQVLELLDKGVSIGQVVKVLSEQLTDSEQSGSVITEAETKTKINQTQSEWNDHQETLLCRIHTYDVFQLETFHHELLSNYAIEELIENLIRPTLEVLKHQAAQLETRSGDYNFYSVFLLHRIGGLSLRTNIKNTGKKLLLTGIEGESNDVDLLLFSLTLMKHGYQIINLGPKLSLNAIPMSVTTSNADGVILYSNSKPKNENDSSFQHLANVVNTPIFIKYSKYDDYDKKLLKAGLYLLPNGCQKLVPFIEKKLNKGIK